MAKQYCAIAWGSLCIYQWTQFNNCNLFIFIILALLTTIEREMRERKGKNHKTKPNKATTTDTNKILGWPNVKLLQVQWLVNMAHSLLVIWKFNPCDQSLPAQQRKRSHKFVNFSQTFLGHVLCYFGFNKLFTCYQYYWSNDWLLYGYSFTHQTVFCFIRGIGKYCLTCNNIWPYQPAYWQEMLNRFASWRKHPKC